MDGRQYRLALVVSVLLVLTACSVTSFDDFKGVNLIVGAGAADLSSWTADQNATYMNLEGVPGESGPGGSQAFRLEIVNLFKNGDFQDPLTADWALTQTGTADTFAIAPAAGGNVLRIEVSSFNRLRYSLSTGTGDGLVPGAGYLIRFSFDVTQAGMILSYNNGVMDLRLPVWNILAGGPGTFPTATNPQDPSFVAVGGAAQYFSINAFGASSACSGSISNMRLSRVDVPSRISLLIPYSQGGRPDLIPGTYRFSVYVKADPLVTPATHNRFPATGVSIAVDGAKDGSFTYSTQAAKVAHPTDPGADWSSWTEVSGDFSITSFPAASAPHTPLLKISITPTDVSGGALTEDVGSLLVAKPVLEFIPAP